MIYKPVYLQNIEAKSLIHSVYDQNKTQTGWMIPSILWIADRTIWNNCLTAKQWL